MDNKSFVPEGYNAVMPALAIQNALSAMAWYKDVFNAQEKMFLKDPSGTVAHAELVIGDSVIMLAEENPAYNKSPKTLGGNSVNLCMYVDDVDALIQKAVDKGARVIIPAENHFYGDRSGRIEDPFGYIWIISTHIQDIRPDEMQKLMEDMMSSAKQ